MKEEVYKTVDNAHTQVKDYELLMQSDIIPYLTSAVRNCQAGQLSGHLNRWKSITSDKSILESNAGEKMESDAPVPSQTVIQHTSISQEHQEQVDKEIKSLLQKGMIEKSIHEPGEFVSPTFTVPKSDRYVCLILALTEFN